MKVFWSFFFVLLACHYQELGGFVKPLSIFCIVHALSSGLVSENLSNIKKFHKNVGTLRIEAMAAGQEARMIFFDCTLRLSIKLKSMFLIKLSILSLMNEQHEGL